MNAQVSDHKMLWSGYTVAAAAYHDRDPTREANMGKLEQEVTRDMAGMSRSLEHPLAGAGVNLEGLDPDERFSLILGRLDSHRNAILRLARAIEKLG